MATTTTAEDYFERREIAGKKVYVVHAHHHVFPAWAEQRLALGEPFVLVTLDHHTDTREAFIGFACQQSPWDEAKRKEVLAERATWLGWEDPSEVLAAVQLLRHDEHIDAAARAGILRAAFCIQHTETGGQPRSREELADHAHRFATFPPDHSRPHPERPFTYDAPANRVFAVPDDEQMNCLDPAEEGEAPRRFNFVLEAWYLARQLELASEMSQSVGLDSPVAAPYVLDIDLDVFHSARAIEPEDTSKLYELIRGAVAITIATEAKCVHDLWRDPEHPFSADELLARMLTHIKLALA